MPALHRMKIATSGYCLARAISTICTTTRNLDNSPANIPTFTISPHSVVATIHGLAPAAMCRLTWPESWAPALTCMPTSAASIAWCPRTAICLKASGGIENQSATKSTINDQPFFPGGHVYQALDSRYETMSYRRCGKSGIQLPLISLGLWHNFGGVDNFE